MRPSDWNSNGNGHLSALHDRTSGRTRQTGAGEATKRMATLRSRRVSSNGALARFAALPTTRRRSESHDRYRTTKEAKSASSIMMYQSYIGVGDVTEPRSIFRRSNYAPWPPIPPPRTEAQFVKLAPGPHPDQWLFLNTLVSQRPFPPSRMTAIVEAPSGAFQPLVAKPLTDCALRRLRHTRAVRAPPLGRLYWANGKRLSYRALILLGSVWTCEKPPLGGEGPYGMDLGRSDTCTGLLFTHPETTDIRTALVAPESPLGRG